MWCSRLNINTSTRNSWLPCSPLRSSCLIATTYKITACVKCTALEWSLANKIESDLNQKCYFNAWKKFKQSNQLLVRVSKNRVTVESSVNAHTWLELPRRPLYTLPKPPSPIRQSLRKFPVAAANSLNVKVLAAIWLDPPSLVAFFMLSEDKSQMVSAEKIWKNMIESKQGNEISLVRVLKPFHLMKIATEWRELTYQHQWFSN